MWAKSAAPRAFSSWSVPKMLARRCTIPVAVRVDLAGRIPDSTEAAAYYVVA